MPKPLPRNSIFICYRRLDAEEMVDRMYSELAPQFSSGAIFRDVDSIPPGTLFPDYIAQCLHGCPVVLIFMGREWLDARDERGSRRLDDPADHVRIEIETALALPGARVIPVLVRRAEMPAEDQLPASLRSLRLRSAVFIRSTGADYKHDVDVLAHVLRRSVEEVLAGRSATPSAPLPLAAKDGRSWFEKAVMTIFGLGLLFVGACLAIFVGIGLLKESRRAVEAAGLGALGMALIVGGLKVLRQRSPNPMSARTRRAWGAAAMLLGVIYVVESFFQNENEILPALQGCAFIFVGVQLFRGRLGSAKKP
ncbi:MAG: toll/interleukin-1 receptor domain-containing protein [Chthoniobacteraceae bacterium]